MLRRFTFALALVVPSAAFAQEGEPCDPATFVSTCAGDEITLCGAQNEGDPNTQLVFNCSNEFYVGGDGNPIVDDTLSCVVPDATGTVPPGLQAQCWGEAAGATCQGAIGIITQGADALIIGCGPGLSCTLAAGAAGLGDSCAAAPIDCAEDTGAVCNGDSLSFCALGGEGFIFTDPVVADCAALGGTCKTENDFTACFGAEGGLCSPEGFLAVCDEGLECVPDPAQNNLVGNCTPAAEGEGEGEEGEGEGEDNAECEDDSDCGDGETCEDGECIAPPPTCASPGSMKVPFAGLALVTLLVPLFRRRRV